MRTLPIIRWSWLPISALMLLVTSPLSAHPGHDLGAYGAAHIATSPYHLAVLAGFGVVAFLAARLIRHRICRRWIQFAGIAMIVCAALLWMSPR